MPPVIIDLVNSKKFIVALVVTIAVFIAAYTGAMDKAQVLTVLGTVWPVYLASQGLGDIGEKLGGALVQKEETISADRAAQRTHMAQTLQGMAPVFSEIMGKAVGGFVPGNAFVGTNSWQRTLAALKKGEEVILLEKGPVHLATVLEDVAECSVDAGEKVIVQCSFKGASGEIQLIKCNRLDICKVPPGSVLPKDPPVAPAPSA